MSSDHQKVRLCYITAISETQYRFLDGQNLFMRNSGFVLSSVSTCDAYTDLLRQRDDVTVHPVFISRRISPFVDFFSLVKIVRIISKIRPHILHVSTPKAALLGALAGKLLRVPVVIYFSRGSATENESGLRRTLYRLLEWFTAKLSNEVVCVSASLLTFLRKERILSSQQGVVLGDGMSNGVDTERFSPDHIFESSIYDQKVVQWENERCDIIGFVGRLAIDKGIGELEKSWSSIKMNHPNARLLLVGEWDKAARVPDDVKARLEADELVCFAGVVKDVVPWLKVIDILAFPTHGTEGFPNAVAEAAAMEIPVVGSNVIGVVDAIVDGKTGVIIPKNDSGALADAISGYLDDPMKRKTDGASARLRVIEKFQRVRIWKNLLRIYQETLCDQDLGELAGQLDDGVDDNKCQSQRAA